MRIVPVDQREIQTEFHSGFGAGLRQFTYIVSSGRREVHAVVVCSFCIEHAETVVMLCSEDDRAHARLLGKGYDFACIKGLRVKHICSLGIPVAEDAGKRLDLLAVAASYRFTFPDSSQMGIQPEMDEHRIFVALPPFESLARSILGEGQQRYKEGCQYGCDLFHLLRFKILRFVQDDK